MSKRKAPAGLILNLRITKEMAAGIDRYLKETPVHEHRSGAVRYMINAFLAQQREARQAKR